MVIHVNIRGMIGSFWERLNRRRSGDRSITGKVSSFLVSFCNVRVPGSPVLAIVVPGEGPKKMRMLDVNFGPSPYGATGLCRWQDKVVVCLQGVRRAPNRFAVIDPASGFEPVSGGNLPSGPHSVTTDGEGLYFAISGEDSVYRARLRGRDWEVSRLWTLPGSTGERDENHVNGIAFVGKSLCVSGFDRKKAEDWRSADNGFVYDVSEERYLIQGLGHPHSLLYAGGEALTCESKRNRVVSKDEEVAVFPSTYLRGFFLDSHYVYAASSKRRKFSESGAEEGAGKEYDGTCCVYRMRSSDGEIRKVVDVSKHRNEIYDLLPLEFVP